MTVIISIILQLILLYGVAMTLLASSTAVVPAVATAVRILLLTTEALDIRADLAFSLPESPSRKSSQAIDS